MDNEAAQPVNLVSLVRDNNIDGPEGIKILLEICPGSRDVIEYASRRCQIKSRNSNGGAEPVKPSTDEVRAEVAVITDETMNTVEQQRDEIANLRREKEGLGRRIRNLEGRKRDLEGRNRDLEGRNRDLEGRNRDLVGRKRDLEGENQELQAKVRKLEESLGQVKGKLVHGYGIQETRGN